ncbi:MAG: hypothetical protein QM808_03835 [Steroidobacteraceae bacterium]
MKFLIRCAALTLLSLANSWGANFLKNINITCDLNDPAAGLVLFSATTPITGSASDPTGIWFHFNQVGRNSFSDQKAFITHEQLLKDVPSDFSNGFGRLYALKLKAGEYEFKKWSFTQANPGERAVRTQSSSSSLSKLPFKVEPGKVIYLGSFVPSMVSNRELTVSIADQGERDTQVFTQKCPTINASNIERRLIKSGVWN